MAKNTRLTNALVSAQADIIGRQLDGGFIRIYAGTQPDGADAALLGDNVMLAELRFSNPSAPGAVEGLLTFNAITSDTYADNSGTATWFRTLQSDGTTAVLDGSVGTTGTDSNLEMPTNQIVKDATISITSFTHNVAKTTTGV